MCTSRTRRRGGVGEVADTGRGWKCNETGQQPGARSPRRVATDLISPQQRVAFAVFAGAPNVQQLLDAVGAGARTLGAAVEAIYPRQPAKVRMAARMTMKAHVEYLQAQGHLRATRGLFGRRLELA